MLRISRSSLAWFALCGLMAPAAARADLPSAWPIMPAAAATKPADSSATLTSYYADDTPAQADLVPSTPEAPAALQTSATATITTAPSCSADPATSCAMPSAMASCFGDCRARCLQPFVGVEAVLLAPVTNHGGGQDNYTFGQYNNFGLGSQSTFNASSINSSSVNGMVVTPRIWAGVMGECWGVGVRYWRFNNTSGGETAALGPGSSVFQQGALKLQTFDLEAIRRCCYCGNQLWITGGVRYAQFDRNSTVQSYNFLSGGPMAGTYTGAASSGAGFNGVGPTVGLYGLKPIGCSCWNLFYGGRASYLWDGSSAAYAQTNATANANVGGGSGVGTNFAGGSGNGNAFIGELQIGAQYNHQMTCFPGTAFFRIAGEYQYWHVNNGANANSTTFAGLSAGSITTAAVSTASAGNSTLGLLGFGIATGFMW